MKKIGIFYGSTTGSTGNLATTVANTLNVDKADVHDVSGASPEAVLDYDVLLIGSSTWGYGDLQDDMEFFLPKLTVLNLTGKKVGLFGCGDSSAYPDTFCNALAEIKEQLSTTGCTFIGDVPSEGYTYEDSRAEEDGQLIGLLIDDMNEDHLTGDRLTRWLGVIQKSLS